MADKYETVYTVTDYYDGPRMGVADFHGVRHAYEAVFDDDTGNWEVTEDGSDVFLLQPIDAPTLALVQEDWRIWQRWEAAHHAEQTSSDTHPALPEDRERHEQLKPILAERLAAHPATALRVAANFKVEPDTALAPGIIRQMRVHWTLLGDKP